VHYAVQGGNIDILNWLLKNLSFDAKIIDSLGRTATHIAASMGSTHMLQCLHLHQQLSFSPDFSSTTPLHLASSLGNTDCVKWLLSAGHPIDIMDAEGRSALHLAALEAHLDLIHVLARQGPIDGYDCSGASPLMVCVSKGLLNAVELLLKLGASASHRDYHGRCCLHTVLNLSHDDPKQLELQRTIAGLLLQHSCDVNARNSMGQTPCHIASERGNISMLKFLIDQGGDVALVDSSGRTCLAPLSRDNFHAVTQIMIDRIIPLSHQQVSV
jgi:ankyrin repeat protein